MNLLTILLIIIFSKDICNAIGLGDGENEE